MLTHTAVSHPEVLLHLFLACRVGWASGKGLGVWGSGGSTGRLGEWVQYAGPGRREAAERRAHSPTAAVWLAGACDGPRPVNTSHARAVPTPGCVLGGGLWGQDPPQALGPPPQQEGPAGVWRLQVLPSLPTPGLGAPHADADWVLPTACPSQNSSPKCTPHLHPAGAQRLAGPGRGRGRGTHLGDLRLPRPHVFPSPRSARHPHLADVISSGAGPGGGGGAGRNPRPWQQRPLCFQQLEKLRPAVGG